MDPDRTRILLFFLGAGSSFNGRCRYGADLERILLITIKLIADVCENIRLDVQNVIANWRNRIRSGSFLVGLGSVPDLLICESGHLCRRCQLSTAQCTWRNVAACGRASTE